MSTKVQPQADAVATETTPVVDPNAEKVAKLLNDEKVVIDTKFVALLAKIDEHELKGGTKWYALIVHTRDVLLAKHPKEEAMDIILKSLFSQGKTYSSAQSIRSYIVKMAKEESREMLEKLNRGEATVQETRRFGRKAQTSPFKTNEDRFAEACASVARYASGIKGMTIEQVIAKVNEACDKYFKAGKA
jgi:RNA polymerase-interacting CarD/CdnL/TRCF family regulator